MLYYYIRLTIDKNYNSYKYILANAFDIVDHMVFIGKLEHYGI